MFKSKKRFHLPMPHHAKRTYASSLYKKNENIKFPEICEEKQCGSGVYQSNTNQHKLLDYIIINILVLY